MGVKNVCLAEGERNHDVFEGEPPGARARVKWMDHGSSVGGDVVVTTDNPRAETHLLGKTESIIVHGSKVILGAVSAGGRVRRDGNGGRDFVRNVEVWVEVRWGADLD